MVLLRHLFPDKLVSQDNDILGHAHRAILVPAEVLEPQDSNQLEGKAAKWIFTLESRL